jgi:hypothetical protein
MMLAAPLRCRTGQPGAFITEPALCGDEFLGPSWSTWRIIARLYDSDAARNDSGSSSEESPGDRNKLTRLPGEINFGFCW